MPRVRAVRVSTKAPVPSCTVCTEKYNKTVRKKIECLGCGYGACMGCVKTYIATKPFPICMNCSVPFSLAFIKGNFPASFVKTTLKRQRVERLFENERELIATETMRDLEIEKQSLVIRKELEELQKRKQEIERSIRLKKFELLNVQAPLKKNTMPCPSMSCEGFLNESFQCSVCQISVCKDCHKDLAVGGSAGHVCQEADKLNVAFMTKETKPCPKCRVPIVKSDGCNQMFCVACKLKFDWRTLRVIQGMFHNPEHARYMRETTTRVAGDIVCGGVMELTDVLHQVSLDGNDLFKLRGVINGVKEVETRLIPQYVTLAQPPNNSDLRLKFVKGRTTEKNFKANILKREIKRYQSARELDVLQTFAVAGADIVRRLHAEKNKVILWEFDALWEFVGKEFDAIHKETGTMSFKTVKDEFTYSLQKGAARRRVLRH